MSCKYPEHHRSGGPSAMQPAALLIVIALIAIVVTHWRDFIIAVVTTTCLLVAIGLAVWLYRNHGTGYDPELERQAALENAQRAQAAAYSVTSAPQPAAVEAAPVVHQHLHLHGLSDQDLATVVRNALTPARED